MLKSLFLDVVKIKVNIWLLFVEWIELLEDNEKKVPFLFRNALFLHTECLPILYKQ